LQFCKIAINESVLNDFCLLKGIELMSWWDSNEKVSKVNTGLQIIASIPAFLAGVFALMAIFSGTVILTFIAGVIAILSAIVGRRATKLQTEKFIRELDFNKARRLTRNQRDKLVKMITGLSGDKASGDRVVIQSVADDPEAHDFAVEIRSVFRQADWWLMGVHLSPDTPDGLTIRTYSERPLQYIDTLQKAFESIGLISPVEVFNHAHPAPLQEYKIFVCVGRRQR
jgi:ABC-type multidrug transport system fused ATPase/permease subunit